MYQRGDSVRVIDQHLTPRMGVRFVPGQKKIPTVSGIAGKKAEPICRRHAMAPTSFTARFAQNPKRIPKAVHICHDITNAPRILVGAFSAAKIGTEAPFNPILNAPISVYSRVNCLESSTYPIPIKIRVINNCSQFWETAPPIGVKRQKIAEIKIVPRRPR
jgi:hypothetical protein